MHCFMIKDWGIMEGDGTIRLTDITRAYYKNDVLYMGKVGCVEKHALI